MPKPKMMLLPNYGDLFTIKEWKKCVKSGGFIDYDGYGVWATATERPDYSNGDTYHVNPSDTKKPGFKPPSWATHVHWYNK